MDVRSLRINDVKLITPRIFDDGRGWFQETYSLRAMKAAQIENVFVQDNHSLSRTAGTIRGLHFQIAPYVQGKLVRVVKGSILDVAVDIRYGSPTFGQHVSEMLSADNRRQLWVPPGFAHGFCTLEADTEVVYKVTSDYAPDCDRGVRWNDPALGIVWPVSEDLAILSEKDSRLPSLRDIEPQMNVRTTR